MAAMQYARLGRSGLSVSRLCLGTMTFGEPGAGSMMHKVACDEKTAHRIMDRALDAGINFIDTADVYGPDGLSERVVGSFLAARRCRDQVVVATKMRFRMAEGPNGTGASRYRIVRAVEDSLRRLRTDRIDLYQIHMQDLDTPIDETLRALDDLVRAGKVLYVGASNYAAYRLVESLWAAERHGTERFVSLQAQYNLLDRDLEREHVPACRAFGLGILPWSPLAGGMLTGKYRRGRPMPAGSRLAEKEHWRRRYDHPKAWDTVETCVAVAQALSVAPAQVALAWLLGRPGVTSVVFGARTIEQLETNLLAAQIDLPQEARRRLDEVSKPLLGSLYDFMDRVQGRH